MEEVQEVDLEEIKKEFDTVLADYWSKGLLDKIHTIVSLLEKNGVQVNNKERFSSIDSVTEAYLATVCDDIKEHEQEYIDEEGAESYLQSSFDNDGLITGMLAFIIPERSIVRYSHPFSAYHRSELTSNYEGLWEEALSIFAKKNTTWEILDSYVEEVDEDLDIIHIQLKVNEDIYKFSYEHDSKYWDYGITNDFDEVLEKLKLDGRFYMQGIEDETVGFFFLPQTILYAINYIHQSCWHGEVFDISEFYP